MPVLSPGECFAVLRFLETNCFKYDDMTCFKLLQENFPIVKKDVLASMLGQFLIKKTRLNYKLLSLNESKIMNMYCEHSESKENRVFMHISNEIKVPALTIARFYLEKTYSKKGQIYLYFPGSEVSKLIKNTALIDDPYLSYEVHLASICDFTCGYLSNSIKTVWGLEHEVYLQDILLKCGIPFKTEKDIREKKDGPTPDILLLLPIAIDNHIIKWIESKALFADDFTHAYYLQNQYANYIQFGPGLVIYWLGHTSTVKNTNNNFIVCDTFPLNVTKLTM